MAVLPLMSLRQVILATTLSKSTIYAAIKIGKFPSPIRISPMRVAWREVDIQNWMELAAAKMQGAS